MICSSMGTFGCPNHPSQHLSSSSRRKMANLDPCKTIRNSTNTQSRTNTRFLLSLISSTSSKVPTYSPNSMSDGDTTTSVFEKGTSGRPHSRLIEDYLNPSSCSLTSLIPPATFQ